MTGNSEKNKVTIVDEETMTLQTNDVDQSRISNVGLKQNLIGKLVSEYKAREELPDELFRKVKIANPQPPLVPAWQQLPNQQGLVSASPVGGISAANPFFMGQQFSQCGSSQDPFLKTKGV
ncbi:23456_t:CDS:2 [Cetraspora pellucida]|uniref:23456_t:CDS:1 n=1 Tax=Cetraspora pellucida TaxID=1433469 RepID=A0A9N9JFD0_9GLOM|nr:23456_t:CDS:2 [Cetraspora pellucida]